MVDFPLISIIVITYNSSKTVVETLESVKGQSYDNLELIVSDDCSTDNTVQIVEEWFNKNSIKSKIVKSDKNCGIVANANKGIREASGSMIKLIAGDDLLCEDSIEKFYKYYLNDDSVIWVSKIIKFGDGINSSQIEDSINQNVAFYNMNNKNQYKKLSVYNCIAAPAIGLINKEIFLRYGYFDQNFPMMEDYPFVLKISKNGICFRLIDEELVKYRISSGSVTKHITKRYRNSLVKFFFTKRIFALINNCCFWDLLKQIVLHCLMLVNIYIDKEGTKYKFYKVFR